MGGWRPVLRRVTATYNAGVSTGLIFLSDYGTDSVTRWKTSSFDPVLPVPAFPIAPVNIFLLWSNFGSGISHALLIPLFYSVHMIPRGVCLLGAVSC